MVRNFTIALVAALVLGSVGIASARVFAPSIESYDGSTYPQREEPYCYLPGWPCEQPAPHNKLANRARLDQRDGRLSRHRFVSAVMLLSSPHRAERGA